MTDKLTIEKVIERVLELDGKSVPKPWDCDTSGDVWSTADWEECQYEQGQKVWRSVGTTAVFRASSATQDLIAEYRTLAPLLAKALKIACEALSQQGCQLHPGCREALKEIEKVINE